MIVQIPVHSAQIIHRLNQKTYGDVWLTFSEDGRGACGIATHYYSLSLGSLTSEKRYYIPYQHEDSVFANMQSAALKITDAGERAILFGDGQARECETSVVEAVHFDFRSARHVIERTIVDKLPKVDFVYDGFHFQIQADIPDDADKYYIPSRAAHNILAGVSDFLGHKIARHLFYYQKNEDRFCIVGRVAHIDFAFVFL